MSVVDAVAVEVILENASECSDADRARAALNEALLAARAPGHRGSQLRGARSVEPLEQRHWTVTMRVEPGVATRTAEPKAVEAIIVDDAGARLAHRTISDRSARACLPLARAVGAWASLVIDAEMNRAQDDDGRDERNAQAPSTNSVGRANVGFAGTPPGRELASADRAVDEPVDEPGEPSRSVEIGTMVYLRNGVTRTGNVVGLAQFITVEVSSGWVVRPVFFFGRGTTGGGGELLNQMGLRVDGCRRFRGNYTARRGIEADLCAGLEGGGLKSELGEAAFLGLGPSANLRGELGGGIALEVRGLVGANLVHSTSRAPAAFASGELGMSMRLP